MGLFLHRVNGVYEKTTQSGGTNPIEAQEIVKTVVEHIRRQPHLSLGIVAFSEKQCERIQMELERERRNNSELNVYLTNHEKGKLLFVKNLENVQGDERDIIFISVGYGPHTPGGRLASLHFGPVNKVGGERRLNVLFTRARVRCEIFVSFDPTDIDVTKVTNEGPKVLRKFLEFAQTMQTSSVFPQKTYRSRLEQDIERYIRCLGYECDALEWNAAFQMALAVRHPQNPDMYMLAIIVDSEHYNPTYWVRERDRLMLEVLRKMGWQIHRVWSTDWLNRNDSAKKALEQALMAASTSMPTLPDETLVRDRAGTQGDEHTTLSPPSQPTVFVSNTLQLPLYQKFEIAKPLLGDPSEVQNEVFINLVCDIVRTEGPIHEELVAKRIAAAFGKSRTGSRIQEIALQALGHANQTCKLIQKGKYWMTPEQIQKIPVRRRNDELLKETAEFLPPCEIQAADALAQEHNGDMQPHERIRCVLNLLGFSRTGPNLENSVRQALGLPFDSF